MIFLLNNENIWKICISDVNKKYFRKYFRMCKLTFSDNPLFLIVSLFPLSRTVVLLERLNNVFCVTEINKTTVPFQLLEYRIY